MIHDFLAGLLANPGRALLATLLLLCIIMVFPVIAALRRKAREQDRETERSERRQPVSLRRAPEPREPRFGPAPAYIDDDDEEEDDADEDWRRGGFGAGPPRRGKPLPVGTLSKVAWFGLGVAVGAGLMAMNGAMLGIGDYLRMPVGAGPEETAESAPPAVTARQDPAAPPASEDPVRIAEEALANLPPDESQPAAQAAAMQLAEFIAGMKAQLPMPIGREINLVKVDAEDRLVTLGFAIQRTIPESDYPALQKTLEERFRTGVCNGKDELRIRALNQAGISFNVLYSDLIGKTVARLEVPPNFCKAAG